MEVGSGVEWKSAMDDLPSHRSKHMLYLKKCIQNVYYGDGIESRRPFHRLCPFSLLFFPYLHLYWCVFNTTIIIIIIRICIYIYMYIGYVHVRTYYYYSKRAVSLSLNESGSL